MDQLNPSGRNLRQDLTEALAAPQWVEELKTVKDFLDNKHGLGNSCFTAMIASAMQKARAGDRREAISLIRDLRRMAARQFQGAWSWEGLYPAIAHTRQSSDLTCDLVAQGGFGEPELAELASIWEPEDLTGNDLANPTAGESRFVAAILNGDAGKEYRFGFWERHGSIRPAVSMKLPQFYLGLMLRPNATMNATHRILQSVRDNALATSADRESSLFAALQKKRPAGNEWSMMLNTNAGGKQFLMSYVIVPSVWLDLNSRLHLFRIRTMRLWLALHRWQLAHGGNLPAGLTELVPDYLAGIPPDPWDGSPLRWDAVGKLIYGVGTDWNPDVPWAADPQRQWIRVKSEGSFEYLSVALQYELPPAAKPGVPYPAGSAAPKKTATPKGSAGVK